MKTKSILVILYLLTLAGYILAQTPGFHYQAVLRDKAGAPMPNAELTLHISLTNGPAGQVLYKESQTLTSNDLGMLNTTIGSGTIETGQFGDIIGIQNLNIKIEAELPSEPDIVDFGFTPIGAAPFALYGEDADTDPKNEMQELSLEGDSLKISDGGSVSLKEIKSPWEYNSDSNAFFLRFPDFSNQRENEEQGVEFKYINGIVVKTYKFDEKQNAKFTLRDKKELSDIPLKLRKSLNRVTEFIHKDFNIDFETETLNINAVFTSRDNKVRDFELHVSLGDKNETEIYVETSQFFSFDPQLAVEYSTKDKSIFLRGFLNEECTEFSPFLGAETALGVSEMFGYFEGKRKVIDPQIINQNFSSDNPAIKIEKNEDAGSTKWSMFSDTENNDCYHVESTLDGVYNLIYGNNEDIIAELFANDMAGLNLHGSDCSAQANCKNFVLVNNNGQQRSAAPFAASLLSSNSDLSGVLQLSGDQSTNIQLTSLTNFPNHGYILVSDAQNQNKAGIYVNESGEGIVYGTNVSAIVHQNNQASTVYGALVGGEAAAYDRGTNQLINGEAIVYCPDHFQEIADPNSMTVTITPLSAESKGIAVVEKFPGGFKVKELAQGSGNYQFDYMVSCKRKGQENYVVRKAPPQVNAIDSKKISQMISTRKE